jgi:uncharacterized protein YjdB
MLQSMGHDEDGGNNDAQKSPRGLVKAAMQGASTTLSWKLQGNQGGETLLDPVRGVPNAGGLYGENNGWNLTSYPDQSWTQVTLPDNWATRSLPAGVAWYRTSFDLDFPTMSDIPLGLNISDTASKNYRAYIYVNGWLLGQYINNLGPQHLFALPPGVLNPNGKNTVAIAVWALDGSSTGLGQVSLQQLGNYAGGVPVQMMDSPDYNSLFAGITPSLRDNAVLALSCPVTTIGGGKTQTITGVLTNEGTNPIQINSVNLNAPADWTVALKGAAANGIVAPGQTKTVQWDVTTASAYPGYLVQLTAKANYTDSQVDTTTAMLSIGDASISSTAVSGITLDKPDLYLLPGTTMPIIPIIAPADAYNKSVTWTSSDESVATVDQKGNVTGVAEGYTIITAQTEDGNFVATSNVNVVPKVTPVSGITLNKNMFNFVSDYFSSVTPTSIQPKTQLVASIQPVQATDVRVTWASDNPSVATVDQSGIVTAIRPGIANIKATTNDGGYIAVAAVYVPTMSESFQNQNSGSNWGVGKGSENGTMSASVGTASGVTGQVLNLAGSGTGARAAYKNFTPAIANSKIQLAFDWNIGAPAAGSGQLRIQDSNHKNFITFGVPQGGTSTLLYTTTATLPSNTALNTSTAKVMAASGFNTANATYHVNVILDMTSKLISFTFTNAADASKTVTVNNVPFSIGTTYAQNLGALEFYATRTGSMTWYPWIDNFNVYKLSDTTAPVTTFTVSPAAADGENSWYVHSPEVTLNGTDDLTGIEKILYSLDNGTTWNTYTKPISIEKNGANYLQYYSIDNAGNIEQTKSLTFNIDLNAPTTTFVVNPTSSEGKNGWYIKPVSLSLSAADEESGVNSIMYSLDNEAFMTYTDAITVDTSGKHILQYYSIDKAGNKEDVHTQSINMDLDGPIIVITQPTADSYSDAENLIPKFTVNDSVSGLDVSKTTVTLDGQAISQDSSIPLYTLALGEHVISVTAIDNAGNESTQTVSFKSITNVNGLKALITCFAKLGSIDNSGIANSLTQKLNNNDLKSFINEVEAQASKHIEGEASKILLRDAQALLK